MIKVTFFFFFLLALIITYPVSILLGGEVGALVAGHAHNSPELRMILVGIGLLPPFFITVARREVIMEYVKQAEAEAYRKKMEGKEEEWEL